MTVENQVPHQSYTANGVDVSYTLSFYVEGKDNLEVTIGSVVQSKNNYNYDAATNSVVFNKPLAKGVIVEIKRVTPIEREIQYATYNNTFRPETLNFDIDRIIRILQELGFSNAVLAARLAKEIIDRTKGDQHLQDQILKEVDARIKNDKHLQEQITSNDFDISILLRGLNLEIQDRIQGDRDVALASRDYTDFMLKMNNTNPSIFEGIADNIVMTENGDSQRQINRKQTKFNKHIQTYGAALPWSSSIEYEENAVVVKDNQLVQLVDRKWVGVASSIKVVESPMDLLSIKNPKDGDIAYMRKFERFFIFNLSLTVPSNSVTIIGNWEMELQDAYYASWFSTPQLIEDQRASLQVGYDYATQKGRVFIIDDEFHIKADQSHLGLNGVGMIVRDNSSLEFSLSGSLHLISENKSGYHLVLVRRIKNYTIKNLKLYGDRLVNKYEINETTKEHAWGYGLAIYECKGGYVHKPKIYQMWGDGIYIGKAWGDNTNDVPTDVTIFEPEIEGIRRNGISLTSWDNVRIIRPKFKKVGDYDGVQGAYPKACIDVEPENASNYPQARGINGVIDSPIFEDSDNGLFVYGFQDRLEMNLHVSGKTIIKNVKTIGCGFFHGGSDGKGLVTVDELVYVTNTYTHMVISWNKFSNLRLHIKEVTPDKTITNFSIKSIPNGNFKEKTFGNVTISRFNTVNYTAFMIPTSSGFTVDGYKIHVPKSAKNGISVWSDPSATLTGLNGADTYIESKDTYIHTGWSSSTTFMPNEIWQDPSVDVAGTTEIYLMVGDDFRKLTIGLLYNAQKIGTGCNINGLKIKKNDTENYTRAKCKTAGGWIQFKNSKDGFTKIYSSYGDWIFS